MTICPLCGQERVKGSITNSCVLCGLKVEYWGRAEAMRQVLLETKKLVKRARLGSLIEGITKYAWRKGGVQYVGTSGTTLKQALAEVLKEEK